jgi:hypothetical protein
VLSGRNAISELRTQDFRQSIIGAATLKKADFRTFYRDAHAVECLSDREKMLIGLTVAMMRLCDP